MHRFLLGLVCIAWILAGLTAGEPPVPARKSPLNVAIVIHQGVELLDWAGPGETFQATDEGWTFKVYTVAPSKEPIKSTRFATILPEYSIKDCPPPDILVVPGGNTRVLLKDADFMKWLKDAVPKTQVTLTVCTGAFALAEAGLLDGKEATTHWAAIKPLGEKYPKVKVVADRRVVDQGQIVTSAGVSAGIDGALHVVARLRGYSAAEKAARYMEYRWQPEEATKALTEKK